MASDQKKDFEEEEPEDSKDSAIDSAASLSRLLSTAEDWLKSIDIRKTSAESSIGELVSFRVDGSDEKPDGVVGRPTEIVTTKDGTKIALEKAPYGSLRPTKATYPDGSTCEFRYQNNGALAEVVSKDRKGAVVSKANSVDGAKFEIEAGNQKSSIDGAFAFDTGSGAWSIKATDGQRTVNKAANGAEIHSAGDWWDLKPVFVSDENGTRKAAYDKGGLLQLSVNSTDGKTVAYDRVGESGWKVSGDTTKFGLLEVSPKLAPDFRDNQTVLRQSAGRFAEVPVERNLHVERVEQIARDAALQSGTKREQSLRDLAKIYQNSSYPEQRVAAAKALLQLNKRPDGSYPNDLAQLDRVMPEERKYIPEKPGRPPTPGKWEVKPETHVLVPVKTADVEKFLATTPESLKKLSEEAQKPPVDQVKRQAAIEILVTAFQSKPAGSAEKSIAAKALLDLGKEGNSLPDSLGGKSKVKVQDLKDYLSTRGDALMLRTADLLGKPEGDAERKAFVQQLLNISGKEDSHRQRAAAAACLLQLTRKADGSYPEPLGTHAVAIPATTKYIPANGKVPGRFVPDVPARTEQRPITHNDLASVLRLGGDCPLGSADALLLAGKIDKDTHKVYVGWAVSSVQASQSEKSEAQARLDAANPEGAKPPEKAKEVDEAPKAKPFATVDLPEADAAKLLDTFTKLAPTLTENPIAQELLTKATEELKGNKFGESSKKVYDTIVASLNERSKVSAYALDARAVPFPPGCPLQPPMDMSGRRVGDELFRALIKTGQIDSPLKDCPPNGPSAADISALKNSAVWCSDSQRALNSAQLRFEAKKNDDVIMSMASGEKGKYAAWCTTPEMTDLQIEQLESARAEWLGLVMQTRNYAAALDNFHRAVNDSAESWKGSFTGWGAKGWPDHALKSIAEGGEFPGTIKRDNGRIEKIFPDLPTNLDRTDPKNLEKIAKLEAWMAKYSPVVNQVTTEITKACQADGRVLLWGDVPNEGHGPDGKPFNLTEFRFNADTVQIEDPPGSGKMESRVRVVSNRQNQYSKWYSYNNWWGVDNVGEPVRSGRPTVNGAHFELGKGEITLGTDGQAKVAGRDVEPQHALMRASADGRLFIKDTGSKAGTFVNGKRLDANKWFEVDPAKDRVRLGASQNLALNSDARFYKPTDMVCVLMDGKMQLVPAGRLNAWAKESKVWHHGAKVATAAMDVGMVVTGTIELKAAWTVGAKVAANAVESKVADQAARTILGEIIANGALRKGLWHVGLGVTGFTHQAMENSGEAGKVFNKARGLVMMADITWNSTFVGDKLKKVFCASEPVKEGAALAKYLEKRPWQSGLLAVNQAALGASGSYYGFEIFCTQACGIYDKAIKHNPETLLKRGKDQASVAPYSAKEFAGRPVEDKILENQTQAVRDRVKGIRVEAAAMGKLPDDNPAKKEFVQRVAASYLDAKTDDDKIVAAIGLLAVNQSKSPTAFPDVLGMRWKNQDANPDRVTLKVVDDFLRSKVPPSMDLFDKQLRRLIDQNMKEVGPALLRKADDPKRAEIAGRASKAYFEAASSEEKTAAAISLLALASKDANGKVPQILGRHPDGRAITIKDVEATISQYQKSSTVNLFSHYMKNVVLSPERQSLLVDKTAAILALPSDDPAKAAHLKELAGLYASTKEPSEKAVAALAILLLKRNPETGALPQYLATSKDGVKSVTTAQALKDLQTVCAQLPPAIKTSVSDFLYRTNTSGVGRNPQIELAGMLVSVLHDKNATAANKMRALTDPAGLRIGELIELSRMGVESRLDTMSAGEKVQWRGQLYGRDSVAMQDAMRDILKSPAATPEEKDLKAMAMTLLKASSAATEEERLALYEKSQSDFAKHSGKPGEFATAYMKQLTTDFNAPPPKAGVASQEYLSRKLSAAILLAESGDFEKVGISKNALAQAFLTAYNPNVPDVARAALPYLTERLSDLNQSEKGDFLASTESIITQASVTNDSDAKLKLAVLESLDSIATKFGDVKKLRDGFDDDGLPRPGLAVPLRALVVPGTTDYAGQNPEVRAASFIALSTPAFFSADAVALAKSALGLGVNPSERDPSAFVRAAAFDLLSKHKPAEFKSVCLELLGVESDPELLRRIRGGESGERRLDPDSTAYRERFAIAVRDLQLSSQRSVSGSKDFIRANFPLLDGPSLRKAKVTGLLDKYYADDIGSFLDYAFTSNSTIDDFARSEMKRVAGEQKQQFNDLTSLAKENSERGDQARRALTWIVLSNAQGFSNFSPSEEAVMKRGGLVCKDDAVKRAAEGLLSVAKDGSPEAKKAVAPLLTMSVMYQDRMSPPARKILVDGIQALNPGSPGSPILSRDAGVASLVSLRRQIGGAPVDGGDPHYAAAQDLHLELLKVFKANATKDGIPILESLAEERTKSRIERNQKGQVSLIAYPDGSSRIVDYGADGKPSKVTQTGASGKSQSWTREGTADVWFHSEDTAKKNPIKMELSVNQTSGEVKVKTGDNLEIAYKRDGSEVHTSGSELPFKVIYADGSMRELQRSAYTTTAADGRAEEWRRDHSNNQWYRTDGAAKGKRQNLDIQMDAEGNVSVADLSKNGTTTRYLTDGAQAVSSNGVVVSIAPGFDDASPNRMPLVRERASQVLADLRDSTASLRSAVQLNLGATTEALATTLKVVVDDKTADSEKVAAAILQAGLSKPISDSNDPRRPLLKELANNPHERISLAAALVLFESGVKEDRQVAALKLADISKNGSRLGYRQDAEKLIARVMADPSKFQSGDKELLTEALLPKNSPVSRRPEVGGGEKAALDRPLDVQESYESAKADLLRGSKRSLSKYQGADWWKQNGFELLDERNGTDAIRAALKSVEPSAWRALITKSSKLEQKRTDAVASVQERQVQQVSELISRAKSSEPEHTTAGRQAKEAREALAFVLLSNGEPFPPKLRDTAVRVAASALADIYENKGAGAGDIEWAIKAALVSNPNVDRDAKMILVEALRKNISLTAEAPAGRMSRAEVGAVLTSALETEYRSMPHPGSTEYKSSHDFQTALITYLRVHNYSIASPVLEAISRGHTDKSIQSCAKEAYEMLNRTVNPLVPIPEDNITSPEVKAEILRQSIAGKPIDEQACCREIYRLCGEKSFAAAAKDRQADPRMPVLLEGLNSKSELIRLASAKTLIRLQADNHQAWTGLMDIVVNSKHNGARAEAEEFRFFYPNRNAQVLGLAENVLADPKNERTREVLGRLALEPVDLARPDGTKLSVRPSSLGWVVEESKGNRLLRGAGPPGKTYEECLIADLKHPRATSEMRLAIASTFLSLPQGVDNVYARQRRDVLDAVILEAKANGDESIRLRASKFLVSSPLLTKQDESFRDEALKSMASLLVSSQDLEKRRVCEQVLAAASPQQKEMIVSHTAKSMAAEVQRIQKDRSKVTRDFSVEIDFETKRLGDREKATETVLKRRYASEFPGNVERHLQVLESIAGREQWDAQSKIHLLDVQKQLAQGLPAEHPVVKKLTAHSDAICADLLKEPISGPGDARLPALRIIMTRANDKVAMSAAELMLASPKTSANDRNAAWKVVVGFLQSDSPTQVEKATSLIKNCSDKECEDISIHLLDEAKKYSGADKQKAPQLWVNLLTMFDRMGVNKDSELYRQARAFALESGEKASKPNEKSLIEEGLGQDAFKQGKYSEAYWKFEKAIETRIASGADKDGVGIAAMRLRFAKQLLDHPPARGVQPYSVAMLDQALTVMQKEMPNTPDLAEALLCCAANNYVGGYKEKNETIGKAIACCEGSGGKCSSELMARCLTSAARVNSTKPEELIKLHTKMADILSAKDLGADQRLLVIAEALQVSSLLFAHPATKEKGLASARQYRELLPATVDALPPKAALVLSNQLWMLAEQLKSGSGAVPEIERTLDRSIEFARLSKDRETLCNFLDINSAYLKQFSDATPDGAEKARLLAKSQILREQYLQVRDKKEPVRVR